MVPRAPTTLPSPTVADERALIEAAQQDRSCFAALYDLYFDRVYFFIVRRVGDRDTAEDLTADVFHKALANLDQFQWRGAPFGAWLLRIAANAMTDRGKRAGRELTFADPPEMSTEPDLHGVEDGARLFQLVEALPQDQRQVVVMRFVKEQSIREIATHLCRSEGAVKQLQFRALKNLKSLMEGVRPESPKVRKNLKLRNSGVRNG